MNTNNGLIIVTAIIGFDTRIDVVVVLCGDVKIEMIARFPLFFYTLLRVADEHEQVLHRANLHSFGGWSVRFLLPEEVLNGWHGIRKVKVRIRWRLAGRRW